MHETFACAPAETTDLRRVRQACKNTHKKRRIGKRAFHTHYTAAQSHREARSKEIRIAWTKAWNTFFVCVLSIGQNLRCCCWYTRLKCHNVYLNILYGMVYNKYGNLYGLGNIERSKHFRCLRTKHQHADYAYIHAYICICINVPKWYGTRSAADRARMDILWESVVYIHGVIICAKKSVRASRQNRQHASGWNHSKWICLSWRSIRQEDRFRVCVSRFAVERFFFVACSFDYVLCVFFCLVPVINSRKCGKSGVVIIIYNLFSGILGELSISGQCDE